MISRGWGIVRGTVRTVVWPALLILLGGTAFNVTGASAQSRGSEMAALSQSSTQQLCTDGVDQGIREPVRQLEACSAIISDKGTPASDLATAHLARALAATRLGRPADATADYQEAAKLYGTVIDPAEPNPAFTFRRATAYHALQQVDLALADYDTTIRRSPRNVMAFLNRGILLATYKGERYTSLADFDQAVALAPDYVAALALRGDARAAVGQIGPAIADFTRAIALDPENPRLYVLRGLANARRNEATQALADYERALSLDPVNLEALVDRAALKASTGDNGGAIADLDRALQVQPRNTVALYNRGVSHFARREYAEAIADYSAALAVDPTNATALNNRCLSRVVAGRDLDQARTDCAQALSLLPRRPDMLETQAFVHLKLDEPQQALAQYTAALAIDARRPLALYGRGIAKQRMGDQAGADADRRDALALRPDVARDFEIYGVR